MTLRARVIACSLSFSLLTLAQQPNNPAVSPAQADDPALPQPVPDFLRELSLPASLRLPSLSPAESTPKRRGGLTSVGVRRALTAVQKSLIHKSVSPDGRAVWSIQVSSPGARHIRVHFRNFDARSTEVLVFAPGAQYYVG